MDAYLIQLEGQGDVYVKLVEKDVYDWVLGDYDPPADNQSQYSYIDKSMPEHLRKKLWDYQDKYGDNDEFDSYDDFGIMVTRGSYDNDRAMATEPLVIEINGERGSFWSVKEAMEFVKKHNINIVDEYQGYIY